MNRPDLMNSGSSSSASFFYDRHGDLVGLDGLDLTFNDRGIHDRELRARRVGALGIDQDLRGCGVGRFATTR